MSHLVAEFVPLLSQPKLRQLHEWGKAHLVKCAFDKVPDDDKLASFTEYVCGLIRVHDTVVAMEALVREFVRLATAHLSNFVPVFQSRHLVDYFLAYVSFFHDEPCTRDNLVHEGTRTFVVLRPDTSTPWGLDIAREVFRRTREDLHHMVLDVAAVRGQELWVDVTLLWFLTPEYPEDKVLWTCPQAQKYRP